jgi:hypothetical protein
MAVNAGELSIKVTTDTSDVDKLTKDLKKAETQSKSSGLSFGKLAAAFSVGQLAASAMTKVIGGLTNGIKQSLNLARDFQESQNKLSVTFSGVSNSANKMRDDLAKSFGFSKKAATDLLGATGDLLTGFGFTQGAALDLSGRVQALSADLASFQNLEGGAQRASESLTKALTGETESLKSLGIVVRQNTPEFKNRIKQLQEQKGLTESQAKAEAIFEQAVKQSANAIGDYARTQDSLANVQRRTQASIEDIQVLIGTKFVPVLTDISVAISDNVTKFKEFIESAEGADTVARIAVVIGAAFQVIGVAISGALKVIGSFAKAIFETGKVIAKFFDFVKNRNAETWDAFKEQTSEAGDAFKDFGETVVDLGVDIFGSIKKQVNEFDDSVLSLKKRIQEAGNEVKSFTDIMNDMLAGTEETAAGVEKSAGKISNSYAAVLSVSIETFQNTQNEFSNLLQGFTEQHISSLQDTLKIFDDETASFTEKFIAMFTFIGEQVQGTLSLIGEAFTMASEENLAKITEQHNAEIASLEKRYKKEAELIKNNGKTRKKALKDEIADLQKTIKLTTDAKEKERLADQLAEKQKELDLLKLTETFNKDKEASDKRYALAKHRQEVEIFNAKKAIDIANVGISMATGIVSAWASAAGWPGPSMIAGLAMAGVLSGLITASGAASIGIIASKQPPPPPKFATGGIVPGVIWWHGWWDSCKCIPG